MVVPASCADATQGPPHVPTGFVAATSGRSYHLAWEPPATGPALESYIVQVGGTFTGATPTTSRALSGVAPPGAYTISVAARNSCGIGPASPSNTSQPA